MSTQLVQRASNLLVLNFVLYTLRALCSSLMRTASSANCLFWFVAHFLVKIQVTLLEAVLLDVLVWVSETPHPSTNTDGASRRNAF